MQCSSKNVSKMKTAPNISSVLDHAKNIKGLAEAAEAKLNRVIRNVSCIFSFFQQLGA
jgi:hypothetical protein